MRVETFQAMKSPADPELEATRICAEACQNLMDETVKGRRSFDSFTQGIQDLGLSSVKVKDYFDKVKQRIDIWQAKAKTQPAPSRPAKSSSSLTLEQIRELLGEPKNASESSIIPQSVLAAVPHLAQLQSKVSSTPHIAKTWELRQEYAKEKVVDSLISLGQSQPLKDPIL
ncbi:hypothetical protein C0995_003971 [Termitomyces sp. Mi166|nr:hypothetical protein C0995_003971 [Termitomyces sp. Mi166\